MITAVDTNIFLDVLLPNEAFCDASAAALETAASAGPLVIYDVVYAELCIHLLANANAMSSSPRMRCGWKASRQLCGKPGLADIPKAGRQRTRILSEFPIGAHAITRRTETSASSGRISSASPSRRRGPRRRSELIWHFGTGYPIRKPTMNTTVKVNKAGRVVLPKSLRDEHNPSAGDELTLESEGEHVTLMPVRAGSRLRRELGVSVFRRSGKLTAQATEDVLRDLRAERDRGIRRSVEK